MYDGMIRRGLTFSIVRRLISYSRQLQYYNQVGTAIRRPDQTRHISIWTDYGVSAAVETSTNTNLSEPAITPIIAFSSVQYCTATTRPKLLSAGNLIFITLGPKSRTKSRLHAPKLWRQEPYSYKSAGPPPSVLARALASTPPVSLITAVANGVWQSGSANPTMQTWPQDETFELVMQGASHRR